MFNNLWGRLDEIYGRLFVPVILASIFFIGSLWVADFIRDSKKEDLINSHDRVQAGIVQAISTTNSFFEGNVTTLRMEDGKTVTLSGKINPWQPGQAVSQPKAKEGDSADDIKALAKVWCVADKCLSQD